MAPPEPPIHPRRSWEELIATSRSRGGHIKRRRRLVAGAPAAVLAVIVAASVLGNGEDPQRLKTERQRTHVADESPTPLTVGPDPGVPGTGAPAGGNVPGGNVPGGASLRSTASTLRGAPARGVAPGLLPSDVIAFERVSGSTRGTAIGVSVSYDIATVNGDGTGLRLLTQGVGNNRTPAWSHDGRRIAFTSSRDRYFNNVDHEVFDLWVMDADGGNQRLLRASAGLGNGIARPAWSPDGTRIAYSEQDADSTDVFVARTDGSGAVNLTRSSNRSALILSWSPDSKRIAFFDSGSIAVIDADGTNKRTLIRGGSDPQFSPDGASLAYTTVGKSGRNEIWLADADGGNQQPTVADATGHVSNPRWTPDGRYLVYSRDPDGVPTTDGLGNVADRSQPQALRVIRIDGTDDRAITAPVAGTNHLEPALKPRG